MISRLSIGLFLLIGVAANAQESQWQLIASPGVIEISSPKKIAVFFERHPQVYNAQKQEQSLREAAHLSADPVVHIRETIAHHRWVGPTRCESTDPRLLVTIHDYSLETASGQAFFFVEGRPEVDPCR